MPRSHLAGPTLPLATEVWRRCCWTGIRPALHAGITLTSSWRERLWTVPGETRLGVTEVAEDAGRCVDRKPSRQLSSGGRTGEIADGIPTARSQASSRHRVVGRGRERDTGQGRGRSCGSSDDHALYASGKRASASAGRRSYVDRRRATSLAQGSRRTGAVPREILGETGQRCQPLRSNQRAPHVLQLRLIGTRCNCHFVCASRTASSPPSRKSSLWASNVR
jgi:hypothetical protein